MQRDKGTWPAAVGRSGNAEQARTVSGAGLRCPMSAGAHASEVKNALTSSVSPSGSSTGAKWPPDFMYVRCTRL